jgi:DNA-binding NarL/FixJ family response regulator
LKIVIIEDQSLIADLLATVCRRHFGFEVLAAETDGRSGLAAIRRLQPDLVLLDISLPDMDGLDIAEITLKEQPRIRIMALSALRDPVTFKRVRELGLHGFVDKREQTVPLLQEAIRQVSAGHTFFSPIMAEVIGALHQNPHSFHLVLSKYEQDILRLIGESKSDEEISAQIHIKPSTAQSRRRDIMKKLGIHSTPKLIRYAIANGFTRTEHFPSQVPSSH